MVDEDYEIVSHKEIAKLKREIQALREGQLTGSTNDIKSKLDQMLDIFKEASISVKDEKPIGVQLNQIGEKLETLLDQNQKIAEAVLAVADLINKGKIPVQQPIETIPPAPSQDNLTRPLPLRRGAQMQPPRPRAPMPQGMPNLRNPNMPPGPLPTRPVVDDGLLSETPSFQNQGMPLTEPGLNRKPSKNKGLPPLPPMPSKR